MFLWPQYYYLVQFSHTFYCEKSKIAIKVNDKIQTVLPPLHLISIYTLNARVNAPENILPINLIGSATYQNDEWGIIWTWDFSSELIPRKGKIAKISG